VTDARTLPGCCQGCADTNFNREFPSTRAPSLHELREEGLDTVSMPNERTCREMLIPQRMGPAGPIKSDQETIHRRVRLPATEPRQLLRTRTCSPHFRCCLLRRIDDIGEKNCCQSSIRLGTGRIPVRNSSIPSSSASESPTYGGMIRARQLSQAMYS
jgi:hypothetical protein